MHAGHLIPTEVKRLEGSPCLLQGARRRLPESLVVALGGREEPMRHVLLQDTVHDDLLRVDQLLLGSVLGVELIQFSLIFPSG